MPIKLGVISVDLTANTVSFSDSLSKMGQLSLTTSKNITRSLGLISTAATAMATAVIASLTATIAKTEEYAFSISKMAEKTGTTTEMFSKLAYSAKLAGVPIDMVKSSMERLARTSFAAQSGQKEAVAAYAALGISVKDLHGPLSDSGTLLIAVGKSLEKYGDSTRKTGIEQKLLGRTGSELAPMLSRLGSSFDGAAVEATLFGVVIGGKTAEQAKRLHDSMAQLESVSLGLSLRLLSGVAPALENASNKIRDFVTSADGMKTTDKIASDVSAAVTGVGNAFEFLTEHGTAAKRTLEGLAALQVGSILIPLVAGAAKAGTGLDSIGLASVKMIGKLSGVSAVLPILKSATDAIRLQSFMIAGIAAEENAWAGATYGVGTAWKSLTTSMVKNPGVVSLALLAGGLYAFKHAMEDDIATSAKFGDAAVIWADQWKSAIANTKDSLHAMLEMSTGIGLIKGWQDYKKIPTFGERTHQTANDRTSLARFTSAPDLNAKVSEKIEAPPLPKDQTEKADHLKLKMDELAAAARASSDALRDAGKSVDFQRADEIAKEFTKTLIELEAKLKAQHKTLSEADKATILNSIATRINNLSQASYRDELARVTGGLQSQTTAQDILTQAIGKSAQANRDAAMAANAARRDAGKSDEWKQKNAVARAKDDLTFGLAHDAGNANADATTLVNVQAQINAQLRLNAAIVQGKDAREEAALAQEADAIRDKFKTKGDTNQSALDDEIAANEKLFRLKQAEADLSRVNSMNPAQAYRDELSAIQSATEAARAHGMALDYREIMAANKTALKSYTDHLRDVTLATGTAKDGMQQFFQDFTTGGKSAAQQVYDTMTETFNSINGELVKLMGHQKTDWKSVLRGVGDSLQKTGLEKVESGLVGLLPKGLTGGLGLGKLGTQSNPMFVKMSGGGLSLLGGPGGLSSLGSLFGRHGDSGPGDLSGAPTMGGGISSLFSAFTSIGGYGGGKAVGGDVMAGMTYDVGEMGRERFTPSVNGRITPNKHLGGGSPVLHIDARGANDPAQTEAAIHRAMSVYGPAIAAGAIRAQSEKRFRSPLSKG